jgi:uncharacterized membrane protein (UPF0182 family)
MSQTSQADIRKRAPLAISIGIVAVLAVGLLSASSVYTDVLWFDQLGFLSVFTTQIWAQVGVFAITALISGLVVWINIYLAWRLRPIYATSNDFFGRDLSEYRQILDRLRKRLFILLPAAIGIFVGSSQSSEWEKVLLFLNHSYTGVLDPQFKLDVSFYLFDLPFYIDLVSFLMVVAFLALIPAILFHLIYGGIKFNGKQSTFSKTARIQIAVLAAVFMALLGLTIWLGQYETLTSPSGLFTGATYSDVNASIPAAQILTAIAFVVALLFLVAAVIAKWRLAVLGTSLMLVLAVVLGGVWPGIVQTFQVVPNERTLEAEYIQRNIEATRAAYGLDKVQTVEYDAKTTATAGALKQDAQTAAQIRILDPNLVSSSFKQLEQYRQYYGFENHLDEIATRSTARFKTRFLLFVNLTNLVWELHSLGTTTLLSSHMVMEWLQPTETGDQLMANQCSCSLEFLPLDFLENMNQEFTLERAHRCIQLLVLQMGLQIKSLTTLPGKTVHLLISRL